MAAAFNPFDAMLEHHPYNPFPEPMGGEGREELFIPARERPLFPPVEEPPEGGPAPEGGPLAYPEFGDIPLEPYERRNLLRGPVPDIRALNIAQQGIYLPNIDRDLLQRIAHDYALRGRNMFNLEYVNQLANEELANNPELNAQYQGLGNVGLQRDFLNVLRERIANELVALMGGARVEGERALLELAEGARRAASAASGARLGGAIGTAAGSMLGTTPEARLAGALAGGAIGARYGARAGQRLEVVLERNLIQRGLSADNARYVMYGLTGLIYALPNRELIMKAVSTARSGLVTNVKDVLLNFVDRYIYEFIEKPQFDPNVRATDLTDYSKTVFGSKYFDKKSGVPTHKSKRATYKKNKRDEMVAALMQAKTKANSLKLEAIPDPTLADLQEQRIEVANREVPNFSCKTLQMQGLYHPYPEWDPPMHLENKIYRTIARTNEEKGLFHEPNAYLPLEKHGVHRNNLGNY